MHKKSKVIIYAEGAFNGPFAKMANGIIRYSNYDILGVVDSTLIGHTVSEFMPTAPPIPFFGTIQDTRHLFPEVLILGIAPRGGQFPVSWRTPIKTAIQNGMDIYAGLHFFLNDDPEFRELATHHKVRIWDVRRVPTDLPVALGRVRNLPAKIVLTVGSDCAIGKMSVALEVHQAAQRRGIRSKFIATGQTGILISGLGLAIDRVIGDFMAGATEKLILENYDGEEIIVVEGQGSLFHPGYSGVTMGLLHGALPTHMLFCHAPARKVIKDTTLPIPDLNEMIAIYEHLTPVWRKGKVVGVGVNSTGIEASKIDAEINQIAQTTGLPAVDCIRSGGETLLDAVIQSAGDKPNK